MHFADCRCILPLPMRPAERSKRNGALHSRQRTAVGGIRRDGDTSAIERILADDFIGVDPKGRLYTKRQMIDDTRNAPKYFVSNRLNDVKVRFYGNTAIAQGSETWEKRSGERGRFVWTDTWLQRNGRWQIIAAEDLIAPEEAD